MFAYWFIIFLWILFAFVHCDNKTKLNSYSDKYINDFEAVDNLDINRTKLETETSYYDYDNTKNEIENVSSLKKDGTSEKENYDPQKQDLYPDPFVRHILKNRTHNKYDDNVIKIYSTRVRTPKSEKMIKENQTQSIDLDLKGHDFIDSIMYIYYYGKTSTLRKDLGSNILIIGLVCALAGQLLTIIVVFLKNRRTRKTNAFFPITINLLITLCLSNLLFIVGVQASKNPLRCELIGLLLHYLHLTTSFWAFLYIFIIYDLVVNESLRMKMKYNLMMAYLFPVVYVAFSYAASTNSFEKQKYCWMKSRELIINYMIPVFVLIIVTTILATICLKHISTKNRNILSESIDSMIDPTGGISNGIICANGANIEKFLSSKEILASYYMKSSTLSSSNMKCCEDQMGYDDQNYMKSKTDLTCYDSKFDLGQLSLADLSIQSSSTSSSNSHDFTNFKEATKFALIFQPSFAVCWFIGILALENINSYVFPSVFAVVFNILNWSILLKSRYISPFMKEYDDFYKSEACKNVEHPENEEEFEDEHFTKKDKNNKNLLNQLFQNSNGENLNTLLGPTSGSVCTDQIPLLYTTPPPTTHFAHHKSIGNLPLMRNEHPSTKNLKIHKSEHDLFQNKQISNLLFGSGCDNYQPIIRNSWDTNLDSLNIDCISTISN